MLGFLKTSTSAACTVAKSLLNNNPSLLNQQIRTTVILKRKFPIRLYKKGGRPFKFKNKEFIYDVVENTSLRPPQPLDVILTQYVEGYGEKGDKLTLKPNKAYHEFLLPGLAVYASPENIDKYLSNTKVDKTFSSLYVPLTMKILSQRCLSVHMSIEHPWVLEKWHIRANMRNAGVHVTEESITIPDREISGPNLDNEGKEFYVTITINKTEQVQVRCRLHHVSSDVTKQLEDLPEYWKVPGKAIFPEDQEVLDSMPRPKFEEPDKKKS